MGVDISAGFDSNKLDVGRAYIGATVIFAGRC